MTQEMFNLTVDEAHTFYVGEDGWLVHNCNPLESGAFAQKTYSAAFSAEGKFSGKTVNDVAAMLRKGELKPADLPIDYISRDGNILILNTRSSQALTTAGIPRSEWLPVNRTGQETFEALLDGQLRRNNLTSAGTPTVRLSGGSR